jgi:hypothetical protein
VTRFQKLAATSVALTLLLVTIGVVVRATGSGMGCPDWPLCHGQIIPPLDDANAWIEWLHRTVAAVIGFVVIALAFIAFRDHRDRPSLLWTSIGAVALVGFPWLGKEIVRLNNPASGDCPSGRRDDARGAARLHPRAVVLPGQDRWRGGGQRFTPSRRSAR